MPPVKRKKRSRLKKRKIAFERTGIYARKGKKGRPAFLLTKSRCLPSGGKGVRNIAQESGEPGGDSEGGERHPKEGRKKKPKPLSIELQGGFFVFPREGHVCQLSRGGGEPSERTFQPKDFVCLPRERRGVLAGASKFSGKFPPPPKVPYRRVVRQRQQHLPFGLFRHRRI